ncbi:MAG: hypothetical protein FJX46_02965 [Alphaproteobacteria bacterium]|nr:hypothetical protein [Alphaproteobacteria bacterium]
MPNSEKPRSPQLEAAAAEARPGLAWRGLDLAQWTRIAAYGLPALWAVGYLLPPLNYDVASLLAYSERWWAGERLYVDLIDVNPPLIFLLGLVPVALGKITGLTSAAVYVPLVLALTAWSLWQSEKIWRRLLAPGSVLALLLPALAAYALIVVPRWEYGQREHLLAIALLPWLSALALRAEGVRLERREALATALTAALFIALKPHFLAYAVLGEGLVLLRRGPRAWLRQVEPWAMLGLFLAYALFVFVAMPDYFRHTLPLLTDYYLKLGQGSIAGVLFGRQVVPALIGILALGTVAWFVLRDRLGAIYAGFGLAALLIGAAQAKGWMYHILPGYIAALLLFAVVLGRAIERLAGSGGEARIDPRAHALAVLSVLGLVYGATATYFTPGFRYFEYVAQVDARLERLIRLESHRQPVLPLSPGISPFYPVLNYTESPMAMRFQTMWMVQGAYKDCLASGRLYREPAQMPKGEAFAYEAVIADFLKFRPKLVILDTFPGIPRCLARPFNYLDYFARDARFAEGFKAYEQIDQFDRYVVYRRRS